MIHRITRLARAARSLEEGARPSRAACSAAVLWAAWAGRSICRPLRLPMRAPVVGVGGATLGGSGKTDTAIALARALAAQGKRVALVGHAYRATPGRGRVVLSSDAVHEVGDDALFAARALAGTDVEVVVAPSRQEAVDYAAARAAFLVVDGLLQTAPQRLHRSLLVVDADRPWGSDRCPPAGDLRAPRDALLAAADAVAVVERPSTVARCHDRATASWLAARLFPSEPPRHPPIPVQVVRSTALRARTAAEGEEVALDDLAGEAVGLVLAIARPERIVRSLEDRGVTPRVIWRFADHAHPDPAELARGQRALGADAPRWWLTTGKCAPKLPVSIGGAPVLVMHHAVVAPSALLAWLASDCASPPFPAATAVVDCAPCEPPAGK